MSSVITKASWGSQYHIRHPSLNHIWPLSLRGLQSRGKSTAVFKQDLWSEWTHEHCGAKGTQACIHKVEGSEELACWERVGNWAERQSTCLESGRRSGDPLVVQRKFMNPLKSYRQFPVSGVFSPRNLVLAFIRSSKGSVIQRIRNNWATG